MGVFIILQIFFATNVVLKTGEYSRIFPSFSWEIFGHVTCIASERKHLMNYKNEPLCSKRVSVRPAVGMLVTNG